MRLGAPAAQHNQEGGLTRALMGAGTAEGWQRALRAAALQAVPAASLAALWSQSFCKAVLGGLCCVQWGSPSRHCSVPPAQLPQGVSAATGKEPTGVQALHSHKACLPTALPAQHWVCAAPSCVQTPGQEVPACSPLLCQRSWLGPAAHPQLGWSEDTSPARGRASGLLQSIHPHPRPAASPNLPAASLCFSPA